MQEKLQINICDRWRTSAGWNFSQVLLNVHCSLHLTSKHLHWTEVRNLVWSSRTEKCVLLLVFLGEGVVLWSSSGFSRHVSAKLLRWKSQQSGVFSPLGKTSISVRPQNICLADLSSWLVASQAADRHFPSQSGSWLWCYRGRRLQFCEDSSANLYVCNCSSQNRGTIFHPGFIDLHPPSLDSNSSIMQAGILNLICNR